MEFFDNINKELAIMYASAIAGELWASSLNDILMA